VKLALVSLDQKWEDKTHNLRRCEELTSCAAAHGVDVVVFPEMTLTGFTMAIELSAEDPDQSQSVAAFGSMAKRHGVHIVAGVVTRVGAKAANSLVVFDRDGVERVRYAKMHPFSFAGEDELFVAGRSLARLEIAGMKVGFTICYDLRFPELYSALAKDCDAVVNIANWPARRETHWKTLLQARAIENQVYMVGVNRTGRDGHGLEYHRSSWVIDANGCFLEPLADEPEISIHKIDRENLLNFRRGFSTRQDRMPDVYKTLI
jgi:omega-amidase